LTTNERGNVATKPKKARRAPEKVSIDLKLIKAVSHPDRLMALKLLNEKVASPTTLALEMDKGVNHVAYHVRQLQKYDCIELVATKPRRGATEHFYRAVKRPHFRKEEWLQVPQSLREDLLRTSLEVMGAEVAASVDTGKFEDRGDRHFTFLPTPMDERGWTEAGALMDETLEQFYAIAAASRKRMAKSGEKSFPMCFAMMGFEMAPAVYPV
jgi:hypothetical protein